MVNFRLAGTLFIFAGILGAKMIAETNGGVPGKQGVDAAPVALVGSPDGSKLYVAETAGNKIASFGAEKGEIITACSLPNRPSSLALSPDGLTLSVTTKTPDGLVVALDAGSLKIESQWHAGNTPDALVVGENGRALFVCNRFSNDVSLLDIATGRETARIPVEREPVDAALTPDGKTLVVANLLPNHCANGDYVGAAVSVIDVKSRKLQAIDLADGSTSVRGICVSPDGRFAYAVHILAHYQLPTTQVERGWMNSAALSVLDIKSRKLVNTVPLDEEESGAADPWSVACTPDGRFLCVTHAGTHEMSVIDRTALHEKLDHSAKGEAGAIPASNVRDDFSFLAGIRRRINLPGRGPRALALSGGKAYVAEYFSNSIDVVDLRESSKSPVVSISLGPGAPMSDVRRGEMLFNDATVCRQHWQSCASCHPDGRVDGLNWDLLNDGIGNPKNTRSLLLAHKTPPATWLGVRRSAEEAVRAGFRNIEFTEVSEENAKTVDAYLKSLQPVPKRVEAVPSIWISS